MKTIQTAPRSTGKQATEIAEEMTGNWSLNDETSIGSIKLRNGENKGWWVNNQPTGYRQVTGELPETVNLSILIEVNCNSGCLNWLRTVDGWRDDRSEGYADMLVNTGRFDNPLGRFLPVWSEVWVPPGEIFYLLLSLLQLADARRNGRYNLL